MRACLLLLLLATSVRAASPEAEPGSPAAGVRAETSTPDAFARDAARSVASAAAESGAAVVALVPFSAADGSPASQTLRLSVEGGLAVRLLESGLTLQTSTAAAPLVLTGSVAEDVPGEAVVAWRLVEAASGRLAAAGVVRVASSSAKAKADARPSPPPKALREPRAAWYVGPGFVGVEDGEGLSADITRLSPKGAWEFGFSVVHFEARRNRPFLQVSFNRMIQNEHDLEVTGGRLSVLRRVALPNWLLPGFPSALLPDSVSVGLGGGLYHVDSGTYQVWRDQVFTATHSYFSSRSRAFEVLGHGEGWVTWTVERARLQFGVTRFVFGNPRLGVAEIETNALYQARLGFGFR